MKQMTKQESIEVLKANYPDAYYELLREAVDMAIEALSEPSRQGQRDGLISLQDAIEAIDEITWYHQNANKDMVRGANSAEHQAWFKADDVYRALESVPSAQPEQPTGVQDILQYLDEYLHPIVSPEHWSVYSELYDMVSMLPSAQPEIKTDGDTISRRAAIMLPVMPKEHREYQTHNLDDAYEQGWFDLQKCIEKLPPTQPDNRLSKIADLVEGTIDHFDLDDAMDLIYQIKEIIKNG